jgi:hypothetical protein
MTLDTFLSKFDIPLHSVRGQLVVPAESASHAALLKTILTECYSQTYSFSIHEWPGWGSVVLVQEQGTGTIDEDGNYAYTPAAAAHPAPAAKDTPAPAAFYKGGPYHWITGPTPTAKNIQREPLPKLVDSLDIKLALMIAESTLEV